MGESFGKRFQSNKLAEALMPERLETCVGAPLAERVLTDATKAPQTCALDHLAFIHLLYIRKEDKQDKQELRSFRQQIWQKVNSTKYVIVARYMLYQFR